MRKIILMVSVDGFNRGAERRARLAQPRRRVREPCRRAARHHEHFPERPRSLREHGLVLADADSNPSCTPRVAAFARFWREMPKIVFSRTPERAEWNTTVVREVVPEQIRELQAQPGGDMVVGGAGLGAAFMEHDLIDEYRIYVHPIVIGRGKPLFRPSARRIALGLGETRTFGNGVGLLRQAARNGTSFARGVFISAKDLARKLMRYMKRYNQQAKPIKWRYCDPSDRIRPNGSALSVTGN